MKKSRPAASQTRPAAQRKPAGAAGRSQAADLQPPPTGANRGSPAAAVMKQFAKTKAESSGRS